MNYRLSPSKLEKFRLCIMEEYNGFITKEKVIESIKGQEVWTPQATFGSAFGNVLENGKDKYFDKQSGTYIVQDGDMPEPVILSDKELKYAQEYHEKHPLMTYESWVWHDIYVDGDKVTFAMRTDGLEGNVIHENKTSAGSISYEFYLKSMQWKIYALALKPSHVQYNVFKYYKKTKKIDYFRVNPVQEYIYYPYLGLEAEVKDWIRHLINFCKNEQLLEYIIR